MMIVTNTAREYGSVTKAFHWLTALLILTLLPLGLIANALPYGTSAELAVKAQTFSIHKTLGVTLFFVALARILWAMTQPRPGLLHPDRRAETFAAHLVHWLLYGALVLVPLSGWIHHAATAGFAPIWWPFGQNLPFVPLSEPLAEMAATTHRLFTKVLMAALTLHILGALKHHLIDRDATLRRMLPGHTMAAPPPTHHASSRPALAAGAIWVLALAGAATLSMGAHDTPQSTATLLAQPADTGWTVQDGEIAITVTQLGSEVKGGFSNWTAAIEFSEKPDDQGVYGSVDVTIAMDSVTIGSVTADAKEAAYFDVANHPTANFIADIMAGAGAGAYVAGGALTLKGATVPVALPFTLRIEGDTATATGRVTLDRRNYDIGAGQDDPGTLGFDVGVTVTLTATRNAGKG
jgi:cytochrome b561/polyisoprenoid-binding protein YceI